MKLDRNNYEEYFLLYVDNELTVEQQKQVDRFVKDNPDLEDELVTLQQSRLVPDASIVFEGKEVLMRNENGDVINLNNYEEWLVLYIDDELTDEERADVEKFASVHPNVQKELSLFQQTRLSPEALVFSDKSILYKKEKRPVITMTWWRVAIAAVLILGAGMTVYSLLQHEKNKGKTEVARTTVEKKTTPVISPATKLNDTKGKIAPAFGDSGGAENLATHVADKKPHRDEKQTPYELQKEARDRQMTFYKPEQKNTLLQSAITESGDTKKPSTQISDVAVNNDNLHKDFFKASPVTIPTVETPDNQIAANDVQYASNTNTENKKFRGFLRKATRLIEHTTNINPANDDNKVLIGGMAINLK